MRILYVTPDISWPLAFGGDIRKWNVLQGLTAAGETDALVFVRRGRHLHDAPFRQCRRVIAVDDDGMTEADRRRYQSTLGRGLLTLGRRWPYEYLGGDRPELLADLTRRVRFDTYDLVWFAGARRAIHLCPLVGCPTILDGDDFEYLREWLVLRAEPWYGAKIWNYLNVVKLWAIERSLSRRFSAVLRSSAEDARRHPDRNVFVVPNGTDVPGEVERAPERRLLFVGDLGYEPNRQGLEWFIRDAWPLVRRRVPDAQLDLAGRNEEWARSRHHGRDGIEVHGFVLDLKPYYRRAAASIAPLHAGGGTRLKILESLAHAVPVVSTHLGAFGLDIPADHGLVREDDVERFAAACVDVLTQPTNDAADRGRAFIAEHYDWRAIRELVGRTARRVAGRDTAAAGGTP